MTRSDRPKLVFWDFDGVVKDTVDLKTRAFVDLFAPYGGDLAARVRAHHQANGGMSRYEKLPLYLRWAGEEPTAERVAALCDEFAARVMRAVIEAPWVPGATGYLRSNPHGQTFVLVSATPQGELERILDALELRACFAAVFGAPTSKAEAIRRTLERTRLSPAECAMIGDAPQDLRAAQANGVPFVLRRHSSNGGLFPGYDGRVIADLTEL